MTLTKKQRQGYAPEAPHTVHTEKDEILAERRTTVDNLVTVMQLNQRMLSGEESSEIKNIEDKLNFMLGELVKDSKIAEFDIKIKCMQQVLAIVKRTNDQQL